MLALERYRGYGGWKVRIMMGSRSWDERRDDGNGGCWAPQRKRHEEGGRAKEGEVEVQSPFTVQLHIRSTSP